MSVHATTQHREKERAKLNEQVNEYLASGKKINQLPYCFVKEGKHKSMFNVNQKRIA